MTAGPLTGPGRARPVCHFLAGPYATLALADLGADVIKVEDPDHPDEARRVGPVFRGEDSVYFMSLNWGKRSFGVRLADPQGHALVLDLVRRADIVLDNYKPGVMAKLGLDHASLVAVNPAIITCSLTGFGETGAEAARPAYDYTIQARAGVMSLTGEPGERPAEGRRASPTPWTTAADWPLRSRWWRPSWSGTAPASADTSTSRSTTSRSPCSATSLPGP